MQSNQHQQLNYFSYSDSNFAPGHQCIEAGSLVDCRSSNADILRSSPSISFNNDRLPLPLLGNLPVSTAVDTKANRTCSIRILFPNESASMSSPAYPPYQPHRNSQSFDANQPPAPPPKPSSQEVSRRSTPAGSQQLPPPPPSQEALGTYGGSSGNPQTSEQARLREGAYAQQMQDPGENWLPKKLEDKSKQDLADILAKPALLAALAHSSSTAHPSVAASQQPLQAALTENIALASHLNELEARLTHLRSSTQAQLLSTHALERQWRQKQSDMDRALAPFSPSSLYQRLNQGMQEQEMVCRALEESFLEGDGGTATEREASEWVRRYREAKKVYYSRQERKERWDEGRVGGWR